MKDLNRLLIYCVDVGCFTPRGAEFVRLVRMAETLGAVARTDAAYAR